MSIDEVLQLHRHVAQLQIAAPTQLGGDVGRYIARPAFGTVECKEFDRVLVLAIEQVSYCIPF
ncbi:MAG TPA: hypothetical protein VGD63_14770 [Steroidobacteraceae bacterium]